MNNMIFLSLKNICFTASPTLSPKNLNLFKFYFKMIYLVCSFMITITINNKKYCLPVFVFEIYLYFEIFLDIKIEQQ